MKLITTEKIKMSILSAVFISATILTTYSCKAGFTGELIEGNLGPIDSIETEPEAPELPVYAEVPTPKGVKASEGKMDKIELSWNHSGAASYNVYRANSIDGSYLKISSEYIAEADSLKRINFVDTGKEQAITTSFRYYYRITAISIDLIESGNSDTSCGFCYMSDAKIQPPLSITISQGDFIDSIQIIWNNVPDAVTYYIYRSENEEGPFEAAQLISTLGTESISYMDSHNEDGSNILAEGSVYYYVIQCENGSGEQSTFSIATSGYLASLDVPSSIENLTATNGGFQDRIELSWNRVDGISKYGIYRYDAIDKEDGEKGGENRIYEKVGEIIVPSGDPLYIDTSEEALNELKHFYKVKCFTDLGNYGAISAETAVGSVISEAPVITLNGTNSLIIDLTAGDLYSDPGTVTTDNVDGDLTWSVDADDTSVDQETRGEYTVTYSITDRAGNRSTAERIVKVVANIDKSSANLARNIVYPGQNEEIIYTLTGLTSDSRGGDINYRWKFNDQSWINSSTSPTINKALIEDNYILIVEASNEDDTVTFTMELGVYPVCSSIENGDFETKYIDDPSDPGFPNPPTNVAPWKWDVDWYWHVPSGASGWSDSDQQDVSENHKEREEWVCGMSDTSGVNATKSAIIYDTQSPTGTFWNIPDIQQVSGLLYSEGFSLISGPQYKFKAWVYRGENCTTQIKVSINETSPETAEIASQLVPSTTGWHEITIIFNATDCSARVELFKGLNWTSSDMGEVRFDNVSLSYNN